MRLARIFLAGIAALGLAPGAFAQGCAMCYTSAAAAGAAATHSLRLGIVVLLFPALFLFVSVLALLVRRALAATT